MVIQVLSHTSIDFFKYETMIIIIDRVCFTSSNLLFFLITWFGYKVLIADHKDYWLSSIKLWAFIIIIKIKKEDEWCRHSVEKVFINIEQSRNEVVHFISVLNDINVHTIKLHYIVVSNNFYFTIHKKVFLW